MPPIPKRLLTQTAKARIPVEGGFGGECGKPVTIERVRFEPSADVSQNDYQLQAPVRGTLFIDARNSSPAMPLPAGTLVSVGGEVSEATVHSCAELSDGFGRVHHWEAELR